jgi:hypothetical protein
MDVMIMQTGQQQTATRIENRLGRVSSELADRGDYAALDADVGNIATFEFRTTDQHLVSCASSA